MARRQLTRLPAWTHRSTSSLAHDVTPAGAHWGLNTKVLPFIRHNYRKFDDDVLFFHHVENATDLWLLALFDFGKYRIGVIREEKPGFSGRGYCSCLS